MKILIDANRCTGHGRCYSLTPGLFDADDEGYGTVLADQVESGSPLAEGAERAIRNCPESAIRLEEA